MDCRCLSPLLPALLEPSSPSGVCHPSAVCPPPWGGHSKHRAKRGVSFSFRQRWPCLLLLLPRPHLQLELQFEALAGLGSGREREWEEGAGGSQRKPEQRGLRGGAGCTHRPGTELGIASGSRSQCLAGTAGVRRWWLERGVPNLSPLCRGKRPRVVMGAGHYPRLGDSGDMPSLGSSLGWGQSVTSPPG